MNLRQGLRYSVLFFFLFPFLVLLAQFPSRFQIDFEELLWAFKNTLIQSFFSAMAALVLGCICAFGLLRFAQPRLSRWRSTLEIFVLAPSFLPPIFTLLSLFNIIDPFPMGIIGIILVHTFIYFGLVAVSIARVIEGEMGKFVEAAMIMGTSKFKFIYKVLLPLIRNDLIFAYLFVFMCAFASFSVPLTVGGGRGTTLEVLIYEKIRLSLDWGGAILLASIQSIILFLISLVVIKSKPKTRNSIHNLRLIQSNAALIVLLVFVSIYFIGYFQGLIYGLPSLVQFYELYNTLLWDCLGTLGFGLLTALFCYLFLILLVYLQPLNWLDSFLTGYVAPSTALTGFAFLVWMAPNFWGAFLTVPLAFTLLCLSGLYRLGWQAELQRIYWQWEQAQLLGSTPELFFKKVSLPLLHSKAVYLSGIGLVWVCGDFALSRILAPKNMTLAMTTETLMQNYRLGMASVLSFIVVLMTGVCFMIWLGVGNVLYRRLIRRL